MEISLNPKMTRMTQFFPEGRGAGALRLGVAGDRWSLTRRRRREGNREGEPATTTSSTSSSSSSRKSRSMYQFCTSASAKRFMSTVSSYNCRQECFYIAYRISDVHFNNMSAVIKNQEGNDAAEE